MFFMFGLTEILYSLSHSAGQRYECARFDVYERHRHPLGHRSDAGRSYAIRVARETALVGMSMYTATFHPRKHSVDVADFRL